MIARYNITKPRRRYPSRAFAAVFWVVIGIGFVLMWTIPLTGVYYPYNYIESVGLGAISWGIFFIWCLFYTIRYGLKGIRKCPNCGIQNYTGRKHCKSCGARVFWYCPKCGVETKKNREFCECGQSLQVVTYARQVQFEGEKEHNIETPSSNSSNVVVTGSIVQFCPACGAEIEEDLTHCSICGSKLGE
jgi:hypothetical protein